MQGCYRLLAFLFKMLFSCVTSHLSANVQQHHQPSEVAADHPTMVTVETTRLNVMSGAKLIDLYFVVCFEAPQLQVGLED